MLPLVEASRCKVAMKGRHPNKGEAVEPHYGKSKSSKPTLPSLNPCVGSIGLYASVCIWACISEHVHMREACKMLAFLTFTAQCIPIRGYWRQDCTWTVFHLAMGHSLLWCNHFIMVMEFGFNFPFSAAACWCILTSAWREKWEQMILCCLPLT